MLAGQVVLAATEENKVSWCKRREVMIKRFSEVVRYVLAQPGIDTGGFISQPSPPAPSTPTFEASPAYLPTERAVSPGVGHGM